MSSKEQTMHCSNMPAMQSSSRTLTSIPNILQGTTSGHSPNVQGQNPNALATEFINHRSLKPAKKPVFSSVLHQQ